MFQNRGKNGGTGWIRNSGVARRTCDGKRRGCQRSFAWSFCQHPAENEFAFSSVVVTSSTPEFRCHEIPSDELNPSKGRSIDLVIRLNCLLKPEDFVGKCARQNSLPSTADSGQRFQPGPRRRHRDGILSFFNPPPLGVSPKNSPCADTAVTYSNCDFRKEKRSACRPQLRQNK